MSTMLPPRRKPVWQLDQSTQFPLTSAIILVIAVAVVAVSAGFVWYGLPLDDRRPIALGVAGLAFGFILLLWKIPHLQVSDSELLTARERIELQDKTRATLAQILGGIVLLIGIFTAAENLRSSKESEFTDRLLRCVQLLSADRSDGQKQIDSRVGAIHALDEISRQSQTQGRVVMEILAAYIQTNAPQKGQGSNGVPTDASVPDADVQAAMNVLVRRDKAFDPPNGWIELSGTHLAEADFTAGADVSDAKTGSVASLGKIRLVASDLNFAFLVGVNLSQTVLTSASLKGAFLNKADLSHSDLRGIDLSFAHLVDADLTGAQMAGTKLFGADLTGAKVSEEQIDSALGNRVTALPQGIATPRSWLTF